MKVFLYFEAEKMIQTSGIGRAFAHQKEALTKVGVPYTTSPEEGYDILHINTVGPSSSFMISQARKDGKKIIYHAHSTEEDFRNSFILSNQIAPFFKKYLIMLYSSADLILTPTPYSKELIKGYGINVPIQDVSNGIDLDRFAYDEEKVKAFKRYFGIPEGKKVVISVGLYFERKGILDFMEVARRLPDYQFIWFGFTPLISIPKHVQDAIKNHPDNVVLPGYIKGAVIQGAYMGADCFFFPSNEETEGIVVLEALAAKQNVIVRDIDVYNPWLVDGKNCYKGHNVDHFVELVDKIVNKQLPSTQEEGYLTAQEKSIENVGKMLKKAYQRVLDME